MASPAEAASAPMVLAQLDLGGKIRASETDPADLQDGINAYTHNDFQVALAKLEPLANKNDAIAQFCVGKMYMQGQGVEPDYKKAINWLNNAAAQGNAEAQAFLGFVNYYGLGVEQDYKAAALWTRKAAEHGVEEAQHNLGWMYQKGQGVAQDWVQAYKWLKIAASSGEEGAIAKLKAAEVYMLPAQIEEANTLAKEWQAQHK
ncbi:MAG: sel1 repeat family protein [Nitrosomonadales bacterium]|nr:sel1 repeat family protein [Nitrosomonadales bacterium]